MTLRLEHQGPVSRVILDYPPQNLLTIDIMDGIVEAHREAASRAGTRVILTESAVPGMFSNGLDPQYVLNFAETERVQVFRAVGRMLHGLFSLDKPHICKITGPAMAGGAILAITADFRLFDTEHGRISFSEPKVGLPIPGAVQAVIGQFSQPRYLRDIVLMAKNLDAPAALAAGLADGAASGNDLDEMVRKWAERLVRLSPSVLAATKKAMREKVRHETAAFLEGDPRFDRFTGDQFLGEGLRALVDQRFPRFDA